MNSSVPQDLKVGPGAYVALAFAAVFFSGLLGGKEWYGVFDFTTLNGAFGKVVSKASLEDGTLTTATSAFRGTRRQWRNGRVSLCARFNSSRDVCPRDDQRAGALWCAACGT